MMTKFYDFINENSDSRVDHILDGILDKISDNGMDSLTQFEIEYLQAYKNGTQDEVLSKYNNDESDNRPPISHGDYSDENYTDEEIQEDVLEEYWDSLMDEEFNDFIDEYNIPDEAASTRWSRLSGQIKTLFRDFLIKRRYI